jgi:hypothetical protein
MDYGGVLSRAWRIIWRFKVLWIFGILAGCGQAGSSSSGNAASRYVNYNIGPQDYNRFFERIPAGTWILIALAILVVFLIIWLIAIFLGTIGRIGIIRGVQQAEQGAEKLIFGELFSGSTPYFWRVFGLTFLVGLISLLAFLILGLPLIICTFGIALVCIIPIGWFIQLVVEQACNAIVLENLGIMDGFRRGWDVVTKNLGSMIIMALILYLGISLIVGFIIGLPLLIAFGPLVGVMLSQAVTGTEVTTPPNSTLIFAGICFVLYLPVLLVLSGILRSYISSSWTLTYLRLTGRSIVPPPQGPVQSFTAPS